MTAGLPETMIEAAARGMWNLDRIADGRCEWEARHESGREWDIVEARAALEAAGIPGLLARVEEAETAMGEALMRARLALTALDLLADSLSSDRREPDRILSALCHYLVEQGAVDPMEDDAQDAERNLP